MASSAEISNHEEKLRTVIDSNHQIRHTIQHHVHHFLQLREDLLQKSGVQQLPAYKNLLLPLIEGSCIERLNIRIASERVQLAFCGENSSGKSAFIQTFLGIGKILPSGDGPVTARITKLTYASGDQARICVRKTLRDETSVEDQVDLSPFFADSTPKWLEIKRALEKHLKRPTDLIETSIEFTDWARHFVEIHIPSSTLASGIDVYDTSGFLLDDAPVLKDILRDLVELVHPTIVFMYEHASTNDATRGCFLALKTALRDLDSGSIFFLNSKVDIDHMKSFKHNMKLDDFLVVLAQERAARYQYLLNAPFLANDRLEGLPKSIEECRCFDLCSVNSQGRKPYGPKMNETTIQHIIQFVANNDLVVATRISRVVFPIIDGIFKLLHTSSRTPEEWLCLREDVMAWEKDYFNAYTKFTEHCLEELFREIITRLDHAEQSIIRPFLNTRLSIDFLTPVIQTVVSLQIIKPLIRDTLWKFVNSMLRYLASNFHRTSSAAFNCILKQALGRQEINDFAAYLLQYNDLKPSMTISALYMINTISTPIVQCARILQHLDVSNEIARTTFFEDREDLFFGQYQNQEERNTRLVRKHLLIMQTAIEKQRGTMLEAMKLWGDHQKAVVRSLIDTYYESITPLINSHCQTLKHVEQYSGDLMMIECGLRAAQDLAKFSGNQPERQENISESTMFNVFTVNWETERNLVVKKCNQTNAALDEAHYHLTVTGLRHQNIFNLRYLYEHRLEDRISELWMIFPPIITTLEQFLRQRSESISIIMTMQWMYELAGALAALHIENIVHGNLVLSNILLAEDQSIMLADLSPWHGEGDRSSSISDDMKGFGQIGLYLSNVMEQDERASTVVDEFRELISECSQACQAKPVQAQLVHEKLKSLIERF